MRQHQLLLYFGNLIAVNHSVKLLVIAEVHLLKKPQNPADIGVIRVISGRAFLDFLHDEHVFRQPLHWLDQIILQSQQPMRGLKFSLIPKLREGSPLHKLINQGGADGVIVEILEVHLEEVHLFLDLLKDDLIVPVVPRFLEDSNEEEFIQFPYLVDVHEDG